MTKYKRIYSRWSRPVAALNIAAMQSRIVEESQITAALLNRFGAKLVILDEASRALEYCGTDIDIAFLRSCRPRANRCATQVPATLTLYGEKASQAEAPEVEVAEEVINTVIDDLLDAPSEIVVPETTSTEPAQDSKTPKQKRTRKPRKAVPEDITPSEE